MKIFKRMEMILCQSWMQSKHAFVCLTIFILIELLQLFVYSMDSLEGQTKSFCGSCNKKNLKALKIDEVEDLHL